MIFFKDHLESFLSKRALHIVWASYHVLIVVKVTMNMAKYTTSEQPSIFEPSIREHKSDIFD